MIDGKTEQEILAMPYKQRARWYKTLSLVDRGWAMEIVETVRRAKISAAQTGKNNSMYGMTGENNPFFGKTHSEATRAKLSTLWTGENSPNFGKVLSEETRAKIRAAMIEKWKESDYRRKISLGKTGENNPMKRSEVRIRHKESINQPEVRTKIIEAWTPEKRAERRKAMSGENSPSWQGGISFEPYCPKFNYDKKEEVRNRDERRCQLCGKPEILEGRRLSVHHIDGEKMNTDSSNLAALCRSCNSKSDTLEKEFLIVSNLNA